MAGGLRMSDPGSRMADSPNAVAVRSLMQMSAGLRSLGFCYEDKWKSRPGLSAK